MEKEASLKKIFQQMIPKGDGIIMGVVISEDPLMIQDVSDEKLKVEPIISKRFYDEPLHVGERVHLLSFNSGKQYYVLDRAVI